MNKLTILSITAFAMLIATACQSDRNTDQVSLIPQPVNIDQTGDGFTISPQTAISFNDESLHHTVHMVSELWAGYLGFEPKILHHHFHEETQLINLAISEDYIDDWGEEGYELTVSSEGVDIKANTPAGVFYGAHTLNKLLGSSADGNLPGLKITDYPRFSYRGLHLDVSRHFMPVSFVFDLIDYMAMHKLNVFHWHLVDDQGWRIEIRKYPKLTEVGAWRVDMSDRHWNDRPLVNDPANATYGGYYTQDEIKRVVRYAAERNITVMPEIEMPAHVMSALAAYPEYSCTGENLGVPPGGVWPITHIYCAGKDETFHFLEDVLTEVMELFPSEFIHIGGDEADKTNWKSCAACQARIKSEGLADEHELQSYFIHRIEEFLNDNDRKLIGWDEILEGGLAPNASVMSWRGEQGGIDAAKMGHTVVMTPGSHCYFDHYQGDPALEPLAIGGYTTLAKVYSYEPVPAELTPDEAQLVLGAQANVWTEYMPEPEHVEYMIFPRLAALSEVLWSPATSRDWGDFSQRMKDQYKRYDHMGINYSLSAFQVSATPEMDAENKTLKITLESEVYEPEIRFTLDGSKPTQESPLYRESVSIAQTGTLTAAVFVEGEPMNQFMVRDYNIHKGFAADVELQQPGSEQYPGQGPYSLVNGIHGTKSYSDGSWTGFLGNDLSALIDLGEATDISSVKIDALQNNGSWIFYPQWVQFEVSEDGENFSLLEKVENRISSAEPLPQTQWFATDKGAADVRYVRVTAKSLGVCPEGHSGEGENCWMFVSEIVVD